MTPDDDKGKDSPPIVPLPNDWDQAWPYLSQLWAESANWNRRIDQIEACVDSLKATISRGFAALNSRHDDTQTKLYDTQKRIAGWESHVESLMVSINTLVGRFEGVQESYSQVLNAQNAANLQSQVDFENADKKQKEFMDRETTRMESIEKAILSMERRDARNDRWQMPLRLITIGIGLILVVKLVIVPMAEAPQPQWGAYKHIPESLRPSK